MSMSISDENETRIDLEERLHFPATDIHHEQKREARKHVCLVLSQVQNHRARFRATRGTTPNVDSRPFTDLNLHVGQDVGEEPFKTSFFANKKAPYQPNLKVYPGTRFGTRLRCFKSSWYNEYKWLEYNEEMDACFCFPCRLFLTNPTESAFTKTGFRDWKHAKEKGKGFNKHQCSSDHLRAIEIYEEKKMRNLRGCTVVASLVSLSTDHKQWLFAVFNVSRYLCANSLPFRGTNESDIDKGDGLFLRAFSQLLFPLEEKWKKIHKNLPKNAKYTSPDIQNEVIEVLASLVKKKIADDVRKAELFTIMADGTTDKNRKEIQGLVCRYLSSVGKVEEHCLNVKGIDDRSAKGIFNFIKETLAQFEISVDGLVSQSFDGASVMSGDYNGLQKLVSDFCDRYILYVHCFLHKIHLVVTFVTENLDEIKEYYGTIMALYNFFKKSAVLESYEGTALKRLIETRWSGHYESTSHVNNNYGDLIQALLVASKKKNYPGKTKLRQSGFLIK
ncbi:zinc finger protein 862-like [Dendronephthya gigantea]|uniref:zinc finger protein 862-like n=1 Tax=Dendronephthya gigantea TaxID=151771 RepID=UPI001069CD10|nr:zinc finger protein 862-like [Dendronephthya gigantea]